MSEHSPEHLAHSSPEVGHIEHQGKQLEHNEVSKEQVERQQHEMLKQAEAVIKAEAEPMRDMAAETADQATTTTPYTGREVRAHTYKHNMQRVRRHLSAPDKVLSKMIHNPIVDKVSEVSGKTVARPSGMLGGGLCAFLATSILVSYTRHNGVTYNYGVFIVFFVGGYLVGMTIELLLSLTHRAKKS